MRTSGKRRCGNISSSLTWDPVPASIPARAARLARRKRGWIADVDHSEGRS